MSYVSREDWILTRSKTKDDEGKSYYGAYPAGFLERVRNRFLYGDREASIHHVCGGFARNYNTDKLWGFGINDVTYDIDPVTNPDILIDVREIGKRITIVDGYIHLDGNKTEFKRPDAVVIDRPYSTLDAENYNCGPEVLPDLNKLTKDCIELFAPSLVLVIDYMWPYPGKAYQEYAVIPILTGRNNKARVLTAWGHGNGD